MLKVGITGGIGSGKTLVCKIFETLGIPVYYADERAKWLMTHAPEVRRAIIRLFGAQAYENEQLNRAYIAGIVFKDPEKLHQLNAIVHPAVKKDGQAWHERQKDAPYTLKEAALIFESGSFKDLDKVITVFAPKDLRIQRILARDQTTEEAVKARMDQQMPEEEKIARADFVIYNDGGHSLIRQVYAIHEQLSNDHQIRTTQET